MTVRQAPSGAHKDSDCLCKVLQNYQEGLREYAASLIERGRCMDTLADERDGLKEIMRKATGTAEGWTQAVYEVLTIELLKEGLKKRIGGKWAPPDEGRLYWSGMVKTKELRIAPRAQLDKLRPHGPRPDITIRLDDVPVAIVETKSTIGGPKKLLEETNRLCMIEEKLGRSTRRVYSIVYYGGHWGCGSDKPDTPANFRFICATKIESCFKKTYDIPYLIEKIERLLP